ncbi:MAG: inhibitor of sigma-G Gin [Desulfosporosinus sp. BRH_c37]|nr:MAG: inhibitor of sigma-G Gin [Desulfosporosinus sp. BRH_c37]
MIRNIYTHTRNPVEISELIKEHDTLVNEGKVLPVCYRCAQVPKEGLYDGFRVRGMFFCSNCQRELFMAEHDSPEYQEFLFLIKGLLF